MRGTKLPGGMTTFATALKTVGTPRDPPKAERTAAEKVVAEKAAEKATASADETADKASTAKKAAAATKAAESVEKAQIKKEQHHIDVITPPAKNRNVALMRTSNLNITRWVNHWASHSRVHRLDRSPHR